MGNFCRECNAKNIDEGNLGEKMQIIPNKAQKENKISNCETNIEHDNDLIQNISNNISQNYLDQQIPFKIPNKIIPESIINSTRKLKLKILQSKYLDEGKEYIINAGGLIGSKRNAKDGVTYFGDVSVSNID